MKSNRHKAILELIDRHHIETQDELISYLNEQGFHITQATISRDIRQLQLTKVMTTRGTYRYVAPKAEDMVATPKFHAVLADSVLKVEYAMHTVVMKTYPGLAQAVAASVDSFSIKDLLGCVAGDDTIIMVTKNEHAAKTISESIKEMMKDGQ